MMRSLNLTMPTHLTEALRTNISGGKTVAQESRLSTMVRQKRGKPVWLPPLFAMGGVGSGGVEADAGRLQAPGHDRAVALAQRGQVSFQKA